MNQVATGLLTDFLSKNWSPITIAAISVVNVELLLWLASRNPPVENRQTALWAHGMWSGMWLAWLAAWLALPHVKLAIGLEDVGSFLLIGCAVARLWGQQGLVRYVNICYPVFVLVDLVWPYLIRFLWDRHNASPGIFLNTLVFAPSLCIVIFAIGLLGWSQLHLQGKRLHGNSLESSILRFTAVFAAVGYALIQVLVYQVNLFDPSPPPEGSSVLWNALMLTWRLFFVTVYWVGTLAWVGVGLPEGRARKMASWLSWLPPVIVTVVLERWHFGQ